jgi:hypothetical protein
MPVKIVPREISHDTFQTHDRVAREAKAGKVIGSIMGIMYDDLTVDLANTGELYRNPLFARAVTAELDDYLSEQTKGVL